MKEQMNSVNRQPGKLRFRRQCPMVKKIKASHTRCRALGPQLIPMYRQSAWLYISHPPGGRLPLLSARLAVTFPATEHHRPLAGTKLYCLVTKTNRCEQLTQGRYAALPRVRLEPTTCCLQVQRSTCCTTTLHCRIVKAQLLLLLGKNEGFIKYKAKDRWNPFQSTTLLV